MMVTISNKSLVSFEWSTKLEDELEDVDVAAYMVRTGAGMAAYMWVRTLLAWVLTSGV